MPMDAGMGNGEQEVQEDEVVEDEGGEGYEAEGEEKWQGQGNWQTWRQRLCRE